MKRWTSAAVCLLLFDFGSCAPASADTFPRAPASDPPAGLSATGSADALSPTAQPVTPLEREWKAVEDARGGAASAQALRGWLQRPMGMPLAARALMEQASMRDDLAGSAMDFARAAGEGQGTAAGADASLELARLEYARGRPAEALAALDRADAWPREDALQAEWLYWRGQSRLALKRWDRADQDFRQLAALWPQSTRVDAAVLGAADCEMALGDFVRAQASYGDLTQAAGTFAAQGLWGLGTLFQKQGALDEADQAFSSLLKRYPASFEAQAVPGKLAETAASGRPLGARGFARRQGRWNLQVGAFSKRRWAESLAAHLRRRHFKVKIQRSTLDGRILYLVKVGPYLSRPAAEAAAQFLQSREKLPLNLVEE